MHKYAHASARSFTSPRPLLWWTTAQQPLASVPDTGRSCCNVDPHVVWLHHQSRLAGQMENKWDILGPQTDNDSATPWRQPLFCSGPLLSFPPWIAGCGKQWAFSYMWQWKQTHTVWAHTEKCLRACMHCNFLLTSWRISCQNKLEWLPTHFPLREEDRRKEKEGRRQEGDERWRKGYKREEMEIIREKKQSRKMQKAESKCSRKWVEKEEEKVQRGEKTGEQWLPLKGQCLLSSFVSLIELAN